MRTFCPGTSFLHHPGLVTADLMSWPGFDNAWCTSGNDQVVGTSFATPLVSGVVALMLQVQPSLTWRDVQHILAVSASQVDVLDGDWWVHFSIRSFGHGWHHLFPSVMHS